MKFTCFLIISSFFIVIGCDNSIKIDYDEIILYKISILDKRITTAPSDKTTMLIRNDFEVRNSETEYYYNLEKYGYDKIKIKMDFIHSISKVFVNKQEFISPNFKCLNVYTDILVFKKNKKIVGIAKFDFDCNNCIYINFDKKTDIYIKKNCNQFKHVFNYPNLLKYKLN